MGQSVPTITQMLDTFETRYKGFRSELDPVEQAHFDDLVAMARNHSPALNRFTPMDFERPTILAMLLDVLGETRELQDRITYLERREQTLEDAARNAGIWVPDSMRVLPSILWDPAQRRLTESA